MQMQALGSDVEQCAGCNSAFPRGAQMNAVEYIDGTRLGWICDECVHQWRTTGQAPTGLDTEQGG
jgi:hypothetical protein